LTRYTDSVKVLGSNLSSIEAAHSTALKTIEEEKKKELEKRRGKSSSAKAGTGDATPAPGPIIKDGRPVFGTKNASCNAAPMNLFDGGVSETCAPERQSSEQVGTAEEHLSSVPRVSETEAADERSGTASSG